MMNRVCWVQASLPNSVYYGVHTNPAQHRCRTVCMRQNVAASVVASALVRGAQLSNGVEQPNTGTVLVGHTWVEKNWALQPTCQPRRRRFYPRAVPR